MTAFKIALSALSLSLLASCTTTTTPSKHTIKQPKQKEPVIAVVLGGGGVKGFAHIGVLDELEKNGIHPTLVVGTSAGAIIGSLYAGGQSPQQLEQFAHTFNEQSLLDIAPSNQGLIEGKKLREFINTQTGNVGVEHLPKKFVAVATEMDKKTPTAFTKGETGLVVQASASIPRLFVPPRINDAGQADKYGKRYMDGGQSALVPSAIARQMGADIVIAVDVMADKSDNTLNLDNTKSEMLSVKRDDKGFFASFGGFSVNVPIDLSKLPIDIDDDQIPKEFSVAIPAQAVAMMSNPTSIFNALSTAQMSQKDKQASDIIITPKLASIGVADIHKKAQAIQIGKTATAPHITQIKQLIGEKRAKINSHQ